MVQKFQPQLKEIQEKYADDKTRYNEEVMKLYTEAKYNPLSGCLPMLLQAPLFMALMQVLRNLENLVIQSGLSENALPATFLNLVPDLSQSLSVIFSFSTEGIIRSMPYLIMLILFGMSMLVPVLLNPSTEKSALFSVGVMSVMMLFAGWSTPAGVLLYWDVSSLIGIGQQFVTKKMNEKKDSAAERALIEVKPIKVDVERRERKNRPRKTR
jgi:YidC/Oxa1 family membrane protein insertase